MARPLAEVVDQRLLQDRLLARISLVFGAPALVLAAIGPYGVPSYGVARRTSEIGIRKALGAGEGTVTRMILRETSGLLLDGLIAGGILAAGALRWIASRLCGLLLADPLVAIRRE